MTQIKAENGVLVLYSQYNPGLVAAIKSLPIAERRYEPGRKVWLVDPKHGKWLQNTVELYVNEVVPLPPVSTTARTEIRLLEVHYIGQCKDRGGEVSAYGLLANGSWGVAFPEQILRDWFEAGPVTPDSVSTLYGVLGISRSANLEEVKTGYRRMVKIWHPDINREPDAAEQFKRVQEAFNILSEPKYRVRYDAGLALEASLASNRLNTQYVAGWAAAYRPPLRCGYIMATGRESVGRFTVEKILAWQDIFNPAGQTLVVSWPMGASEPVKVWA